MRNKTIDFGLPLVYNSIMQQEINHETICKICTNPVNVKGLTESDQKRMLEVGICYECDFWIEQWHSRDSVSVARISGQHYRIGSPSSALKGMSGRDVTIEFSDGRIVKTDNLWHQGSIPKNFQIVLQDNAVFQEVT